MRGRRHGLAVVIVIAAALLGAPAAAGEIAGVRFAERHDAGGTPLVLRCTGLLRYKILFKGYVAALYLGEGHAADDPLADVPRRLEIEYFWRIAGADIARAGDEVLARNVDAATLERIRPRVERIDALYEDVRPGDRYALTYLPGRGTELAKNGVPKGVIPGADFAAAYFAIWLGPDPIDASLKTQLTACAPATATGG